MSVDNLIKSTFSTPPPANCLKLGFVWELGPRSNCNLGLCRGLFSGNVGAGDHPSPLADMRDLGMRDPLDTGHMLVWPTFPWGLLCPSALWSHGISFLWAWRLGLGGARCAAGGRGSSPGLIELLNDSL